MQKVFFLIAFSLSSSILLAQTNTVDYDFLSQAYKQVNTRNAAYFLLKDKIWKLSISSDHLKDYYRQLKGKISFSSLKEIVQNTHKDTMYDYPLTSFKTESPSIQLIDGEYIDSLWHNRNSQGNSSGSIFYITSSPVFDNKKVFAVIDFGGGLHRLNMIGCKYLFKKIKGKWKLISTFDHWAS